MGETPRVCNPTGVPLSPLHVEVTPPMGRDWGCLPPDVSHQGGLNCPAPPAAKTFPWVPPRGDAVPRQRSNFF